jgi:hypothetical protein
VFLTSAACVYVFIFPFLSVCGCVSVCVSVCVGVWSFSHFIVISLLAVGKTKGGACLGLCFLPSDNLFDSSSVVMDSDDGRRGVHRCLWIRLGI